MKRYKDISYKLARISPLREDKEGEYVKYEDMVKAMEKLGWHFPIHEKLRHELIMEIIKVI